MDVSGEHVAALRAYLVGDVVEYDQRIAALRRTDSVDGFAAIATTAFVEAVRRRFPPTWTNGDVIRFVASARSRWGKDAGQIDPHGAEVLVRSALGDGPPHDLADAVKVLQIHLLAALVADKQFDEAGLDEFLAQARARAERIPG